MKTLSTTLNIEKYRKLILKYIDLHVYGSALFWADKVVAITGNPRDIYWLAQCMFLQKQYHRAAHLLQSKGLDKTHILCTYLTVHCLFEANELAEALKLINSVDMQLFMQNGASSNPRSSEMEMDFALFDKIPKNQALSSFLLLKGKVLEGMDNRGLAADCYKQALHSDVYCFEAFDVLIKYQMLTATEEEELLKSLPISEQCSSEESEMLNILYGSKLKKYHTPAATKPCEIKILSNVPSIAINDKFMAMSTRTVKSLPATPNLHITPTSVSTPNVAKNDSGIKRTETKNKKNIESQMQVDTVESSTILKLRNSLDLHVAQAERLYYNCEYVQCASLTEQILREDPYHDYCLPIHISCQVELKQSNKLFSLAHKLVDLYPNMAISWFAVGCYYYIIGKSDYARRFLAKATCLDRLFGPAWLTYGHSFAVENEHDQAMAAYFKASQLMKGCHLPLLYIGLECGLTNNVRLADKFFQQAQNIAPEDPFIMHEKGVICFQNLDYEGAETNFKEALERIKRIKRGPIPATWSPLLNNLGHTCRKLKKYEEAREYHSQALLLSPQSPGTFSAIAYVHSLMGNYLEAVDWFHKALGLKSDDTFSTTMLNYVIDVLAEESPPFSDCPDDIPKFDLKTINATIETIGTNMSEQTSSLMPADMSMSIEVDMLDASTVDRV